MSLPDPKVVAKINKALQHTQPNNETVCASLSSKQDEYEHDTRRTKRMKRLVCTIGSWPVFVASMLMLGASSSISIARQGWLSSVSTDVHRKAHVSSKHDQDSPYIPPKVLYGHLHMAKTAGTTINGELAMHFERVCGNRGYSYDAYGTNIRYGESNHTMRYKGDIIAKGYPSYNRGILPQTIMEEIGFEDCDFVSMEGKWNDFWTKHFQNWHQPLELHLPCRDPVDHLMSQCNHKKMKFQCHGGKDIFEQADGCLIKIGRFSKKLVSSYSNIHVRCFDHDNSSEYLNYMGKKLQKKRLETDYIFRGTTKRNKEIECIWNDSALRDELEAYLINHYDYYGFCNQCIGSKDDLLAKSM